MRAYVEAGKPVAVDFGGMFGRVAIGGKVRSEGPDDLVLTLTYLDGSTSRHAIAYRDTPYRWGLEDALPTRATVEVGDASPGATVDLMAFGGMG